MAAIAATMTTTMGSVAGTHKGGGGRGGEGLPSAAAEVVVAVAAVAMT